MITILAGILLVAAYLVLEKNDPNGNEMLRIGLAFSLVTLSIILATNP